MKIETVPLIVDADGQPSMVTLEITGPIDPAHPVVRRARELVESTGSAKMLASFDQACA